MTSNTGHGPSTEAGEQRDEALRRPSFAQEQLWFLDQLEPGKPTYNIVMAWRMHGPLRPELLHRSLDLVVARHESLRTTVRNDDGTPHLVVAPTADTPLPIVDLRSLDAAEREQRVQADIDAQRTEPYDLATGPLCRFRLLWLADEEYVFCQGFHHIITDGWSAALLNAELCAAYRSLHAGTDVVFGPRELDYTDFSHWQRTWLRGDVLADELAFWRRHLADLPVLDLPADRPRPTSRSHRGETLIATFSDDIRGLVQQLASDHGASSYMVLAAAYNLVLSRYTGLTDIPTGVPMLGRPEREWEAVVGMFINMVVLRCDLSGDPTFSELVDRVADANLELYDHQEVPFHQVVDIVDPVRHPNRNPLFQVSLQLLGASNSGENLDLPDVVAEFVPLASFGSRFDIALNIIDTGSTLRASVEYSSDLFDRWRMEAMLAHLETVLRAAASDPGRRLSSIPLVVGVEAEALLAAGRGAAAAAPANRPVYVVDRWRNLVPRGVPGELLVGAEPAGPATHPFDGSELTADMLVADPFRPGRAAHRTGDLARWDAELRLELLTPSGDPVRPDGPRADPPAESGGDEPRTPTEESVAGIFGDVLAEPSVGAEVSFFDIGGNSMQAMRAVSRINRAFGIKLSVRTMYGNVTVRALAAAVDEEVGGKRA